jgi:tetratricopeptide (TPR) repeat protein
LSRSIHTTRRHLRELERADFADGKLKQRQIERIRDSLEKKRAVKARVRQSSSEAVLPRPDTPVDADTLPTEARDQWEHVHYLASVADVRAVLRRMSPGALDSLSRIVLTLGAEYMREQADSGEGYGDPDPLVGRISVDELPGVYIGAFSGTCFSDDASIWLYAYVYDASDMPDREVREQWLRLRILGTLMHELAHHHDHTACDARGRWSTRPEGRSEWSARKQEYAWTLEHVIPYLEEQYPEATSALVEWVHAAGGVTFPLAKLIDHPDESIPYTRDAVSGLFKDVDRDGSQQEVRRDFTRNLHYAYRYDEALEIIAVILADHRDDNKTRTLQADIYEDQERYEEAEQVARAVVEQEPSNRKAWVVLVHVYRSQGRWRELEAAATRVATLAEETRAQQSALAERVSARLELGDIAGAEADLQRIEQGGARIFPDIGPSLRAWLLLRTGRYEEALHIAQRRLPSRRWLLPTLGVLIAVRYEAAHRLGRPHDAGTISAHAANLLRHFGHGAWLDRLAAEYGLRVWSKNRI